MFSSRRFTVVALTFGLGIHFELSFAYGMKQGVQLRFFAYGYLVSSDHLLKKAFLFLVELS